jgi:hypothetical protein
VPKKTVLMMARNGVGTRFEGRTSFPAKGRQRRRAVDGKEKIIWKLLVKLFCENEIYFCNRPPEFSDFEFPQFYSSIFIKYFLSKSPQIIN